MRPFGSLSPAIALALLAASVPTATAATGLAMFSIGHIEIQGDSFGVGELPFEVGDVVTVDYTYDESFTPTPISGTTTGLDYSGAFTDLAIRVASAMDTFVTFAAGDSTLTASTFDNEPSGGGPFDLVSVFGFGPSSVSGPGFPGDDSVVSAIANFVNRDTLHLIVDGAPPTGTFSNFQFGSISLGLESGALVQLSNVAPAPAVPSLGIVGGTLLALVLCAVGGRAVSRREEAASGEGRRRSRSRSPG